MTKLFSAMMVVASCAFLAGCKEDVPDAKVETARVSNAQSMRSYFDKVSGNYDSLSAEDKAALLAMCDGDPKKVEQTWNAMKYGPGGAGAASSSTPE